MKLVDIREANNILGVSISTLRRWDNQGKLKPTTKQLSKESGKHENDC